MSVILIITIKVSFNNLVENMYLCIFSIENLTIQVHAVIFIFGFLNVKY